MRNTETEGTMNVRSTVKAILLHEGKVLLNRCRDANNGEYYSLPGGGQEQFETMSEAIHRECLEETGYSAEPVRFVALMEEICLDPFIRENHLQYAHKMLHIFLCRLTDNERIEPTETDESQIAIEWVRVEDVANVKLLPKQVHEAFSNLVTQETPMFLGSAYLEHNHG
jgi:ADP-ribose pyrophosphatase YjhB (NUDIX family)